MHNTEHHTNIPVLLNIFNRPEKTAQVINALRAAKPSRIFVAADGPRMGCSEDTQKCKLAREALSAIDWPCEVKTLFRAQNLGCDPAISSAIQWFFRQVEHGVILEDDCVPHPDFFRFCAEIFERFVDDKRVMQISGLAPYPIRNHAFDYHFSRTFRCWGWGTWKRAWAFYSNKIDIYAKCIEAMLKAYYPHNVDFSARLKQFHLFRQGKRDNWDFKWNLACYANNGLAVVPEKNLVVNIGFDEESTHTKRHNWLSDLRCEPVTFPLRHPPFVFADTDPENKLRTTIYRDLNYKGRVVTRFRHLLGAWKDFIETMP